VNYGPLIFLAAFFALASSWFGLVLAPQLQIGRLEQTNTVGAAASYPLARMGMARQGLDVYRANGCAYCHSQQVRQAGTVCDVILTEAGTNQPALLKALVNLKSGLSEAEARQWLEALPKSILKSVTREDADAAMKALDVGGAKSELWVVPVGPDIARGWGLRRSVAHDFLYDYPVMPGSQRIGPDLANAGTRWPDGAWHLRHLYAPGMEIKGSLMPPYRFLFEKRRIEHAVSPDALVLPEGLAAEPGYEIVPKPEAKALAAYLVSMRANEPLFETPLTVASTPPSPATNATPGTAGTTNATPAAAGATNSTNSTPAPSGGSTNSAPTNPPAK